MKCQFCAGDLSIEDAFCPHCGNTNSFYAAHREDMERYENQFEQVKDNTIKKNERDTRKAVRTAIVAVLVALILAAVIVIICMDDINMSIRKARNKRNIDTTVKILEKLESEQDYINFHLYFEKVYTGTYGSEVSTFTEVDNATFYYSTLVDKMAILISGEGIGTTADLAKAINNSFNYLYDVEDRSQRNAGTSKFSPKHVETINNIINDAYILLETYIGIPRELMIESKQKSETERQLLIEKYIEKVIENE